MSGKSIQVTGLGNALVDVLAKVDDAFLAENGVEKGIMTLVDAARGVELYDACGPTVEMSGGSVANTMAGLGMLGSKGAYIGKVADDHLGNVFAHDMRAMGITYTTPMGETGFGGGTGRCVVLVSNEDGERSMNTCLGAAAEISVDDIDEALLADSEWLYLEGYRFDGPSSKEAFAKAIAATKSAGGKASVTLSDPFCVERYRDDFRRMVREDVDLVFANEHELLALYQTSTLEEAMKLVAQEVELAAGTVGPAGAFIIHGDNVIQAPAAPMERVDATGAGDLFAAGFLHGLVNGRNLLTAGTMGCVAAGETISQIGPRPQTDLKQLFAKFGLK